MSIKSEVLHILGENTPGSVSGEVLAETLGCTRAAVWKAVDALRKDGYTIEAVTNRGYRLVSSSTKLTEEGILSRLQKKDVRILVLDETTSTNTEAKVLAEQGAVHGSAVLARRQTTGRGRRGRSFFSPKGGLYLSVILRPEMSVRDAQFLTTAAAVAVCIAIEEVCHVRTDIKWINDLYRNGRKICGILTEAGTDFESGEIRYAVVGIGVNLWIAPEELPPELSSVVGCVADGEEQALTIDRNLLAARIIDHLLSEAATGRLSPVYKERNIIPGHTIEIRDGEKKRSAFALSIEDDGRLLVREEDGSLSRLSYGDVSIRLES